ncbi:hypothetical protein MSG28_002234 [Choristoneura fumiferana]|nr:hypothetical protein MSG28_002234 [Choristoneura fumiferana]
MDRLRLEQENNIAINVIPPDGEEDDDEFVPPLRPRRKMSTPLAALPGASDRLLGMPNAGRTSPSRSLSPLDRTKRRFSTMVSSATASAVSRRLSATIGWCLTSPTQIKPQIVRQGRALCLQYIKTQIRRSPMCANKVTNIIFKYIAEAADGEPALELVAAPAAAVADLLHEDTGSWIAANGGWDGLVERLRASERDQRSEKNLKVIVSFLAMSFLFLVILRWVIQAHPSYLLEHQEYRK